MQSCSVLSDVHVLIAVPNNHDAYKSFDQVPTLYISAAIQDPHQSPLCVTSYQYAAMSVNPVPQPLQLQLSVYGSPSRPVVPPGVQGNHPIIPTVVGTKGLGTKAEAANDCWVRVGIRK